MNDEETQDLSTISFQLRSIIICDFLDKYNNLEKKIRFVLKNNLLKLSPDILNQLYFYYGGKISTYYEYETQTIKLKELPFKKEEKFGEFSIKQIIKIFKNNKGLEAFNFTVQSIKNSVITFSFCDCILRLISMRNKLAHEMVNLDFKGSDVVELLSWQQIAQEYPELCQNYDFQKMDDMTKYVGSNVVYLKKIINELDMQGSV